MDKNTVKANGNKGLKLNDADDDTECTKAVKNNNNCISTSPLVAEA